MVTVSKKAIYELFEEEQFDKLLKLFDIIGLDGKGSLLYTPGVKNLARTVLSVAAAMSNSGKIPADVQICLIERLSICCDLFALLRLVAISSSSSNLSCTVIPEDVKELFCKTTETDGSIPIEAELHKVRCRLSTLNRSANIALLHYLTFADAIATLNVRYNASIVQLIYSSATVSGGLLFSLMANCLHEPYSLLKEEEEFAIPC